jgi:glycine/D-amino acid oxidase-like deaminating enzyme
VEVEQISLDAENSASGIPALMTYPQPGLRREPRCQFSIAANHYAQHQTPGFNQATLRWQSKKASALSRMVEIAEQFPDEYMSCPDESSVLFHQAGWVKHEQDSNITLAAVEQIKFDDDQWHILDSLEQTVSIVDQIVITQGISSRNLLPLPLIPIRGQAITVKPAQPMVGVITGDLSIVPHADGSCTVGSTYQRNDEETEPRLSDTHQLLRSLQSFDPDNEFEVLAAHVGIRAATRDRLPLVGRVPDLQALQNHIKEDPHKLFGEYQKGLYVSTGFGSHGATNARLCGEYIANLVCDEPGVLRREWELMLAVERFELRDARRS